MAIIIPSKNIFEKTNSKIIDNQISNIYVERKVINRVTEYDKTFYTEKFDTQSFEIQNSKESNYKYFYSASKPFAICDTKSEVTLYRVKISSINIPKSQNNQTITSVFANSIKFSKTIPVIKSESDGKYYNNVLEGDKGNFLWTPTFDGKIEKTISDFSNFSMSYNTSSKLINMLAPNDSQDEKNKYTASQSVASDGSSVTVLTRCELNRTKYNPLEDVFVTANVTINNILNDTYKIEDLGTSFEITGIDIFAGFQAKMSYAAINYENGKDSNNLYRTSNIAVRAVASEITLSINGNYVRLQIDTENKIAITGDGNSTYSIGAGNELMQESLYSSDGSFFPIGALASRIKSAYENGKETAEIRCSVSDYYDDADIPTLEISKHGKKKFFAIGDEVIPMVRGKDGKDYPLSINKSGKPKVFVVVGNKHRYSGVFWQILSLQER